MARIPLVDVEQLDPFLRELHDDADDGDWSTRHCARAFASHPRLLEDYLGFYYPYHSDGENAVLEPRLKELVRLRIATLNGCRTCKAARLAEDHLSEDEAVGVDRYQESATYTERERTAIALAERMALDHFSIDDEYLAQVLDVFDRNEFLELTMLAGQYIGFGRLLAVLQLEEVACPIPA